MTARTAVLLLAVVVAVAMPASAQQTIPVRRLTNIVATDSGVLSEVLGVRALPRGRVLVNDWDRRRLVMFDSTMKRFTVITDGAPGAPNSYGSLAAVIVPYTRDSTLFVVQNSAAFIVLDPFGRVVRVMAPPRSRDFSAVVSGAAVRSSQGYDPMGRLIYATHRDPPSPPAPAPEIKPGQVVVRMRRDSSAIVRVDPFSRNVDTLGWAADNFSKQILEADGRGGIASCGANNPVPQYDQWTLLPDGTVAILRAADYHIDWIENGKVTSTPKMPFAWRRLTDTEKQAKIDSAHRKFDEYIATQPATPAPGIGGVIRPRSTCTFHSVDLDELPDYYPPNPPYGRRGIFADRAGNVWILPATSMLASEGLAFDVVNRKGEIFERVIIPAGRRIAEFGPDGILYLESFFGRGATRLERARVAR